MDMDKVVKLIPLVIVIIAIVGAILFPSVLDMGVSPVRAKATQKTCDFMDVGGTTYAFCADGSEYRIADSMIPTPTK